MGPVVGRAAPRFELEGIDGGTGAALEVSLAGLRGSPVILAFYPADDSPVCTAQLRNYTDGIAELNELDATVLAISPQGPDSHRRFAESQGGFAFALLSDVDKSVGRQYGVVGLLGLYRRSIFVVDAAGDLAFASRAIGPGFGFKPVSELAALIEGLA
jgi:peroxiredoxin Q/BCP